MRLTQGPLAELRTRPMADQVAKANTLRAGYRDHAVDLTDPRRTDPMAELTAHGIAGANAYWVGMPPYHAHIDGAVPDLKLRAALIPLLQQVNARLAPYDLELWVFDAWRPISLQNHFHFHWMPNHLQSLHPSWDEDQIMAETEKYWAKGAIGGINPMSPPPHATGSAVDLTIRYKHGAELFMGTIFDDVSDASNTDFFETETTGLAFSTGEARANRRLLYWLMQEAGFANNPTEWWHFSLGDQMWARITGQAAAYYTVPPDSPDQVAVM